MPIKFNCPHCKRGLNVKDHLAGKKAHCPACKEMLTIPALAPAPADADELAMSVLSEKPAEEAPPPEPQSIDFTCPECEAELHLPAELAGKRSQCPECRKIIKVPQLVKNEPKDWRKAQQKGPSAARGNLEPEALEGAWVPTTSTVSRQSLEEADAITASRVKLTLRQKLTRAGITLGMVIVLVGGGWLLWNMLGRDQEAQAIARAVAAAEQPGETLSDLARAEIHRAAGEYHLRTRERDCAGRANKQFIEARSILARAAGTFAERDLALLDLALSQVDLGGDEKDVDNYVRLRWIGNAKESHSTMKELQQTLEHLQTTGGKLHAVREVSRKLVARGQPKLAVPLAITLAPNDGGQEALALAGLEMLSIDPAAAEAVAGRALEQQMSADTDAPAPAVSPSLIALCMALKKQNLIDRLPAAAKAGENANNPAVLIGIAEGSARQGMAAAGRQMLAPNRVSQPLDRVQGYLSVAAAALAEMLPDAARPDVEEAARIVETELGGKAMPSWLLFRLVFLGSHAGLPEQRLQQLAGLIQDTGLRGRARLEVLRGQFAAGKSKAPDDRAETVDDKTFARVLAWETVARYNARLDSGTLGAVEKWDEKTRPLGLVGAVLGRQDGR